MTTQNENVLNVDPKFVPNMENGPDYEHFWSVPEMSAGDRLQDAMEQVAYPVRETAYRQPVAMAFGLGIGLGATLVYLTLIILKFTGI